MKPVPRTGNELIQTKTAADPDGQIFKSSDDYLGLRVSAICPCSRHSCHEPAQRELLHPGSSRELAQWL